MRAHSVVLLVDDEESDLFMIQHVFGECCKPHAIVHTASDGAEAIAYLMGEGQYADRSKFPYPTYIVTDLRMPRMSGFDVLEHLKANPSWAIIPVVVLSSSHDPDDIRTSYALGASSFISKPADLQSLRTVIKTLHDYWVLCSIPEVDAAGQQLRTANKDKMGEHYPQAPEMPQQRVPRRG